MSRALVIKNGITVPVTTIATAFAATIGVNDVWSFVSSTACYVKQANATVIAIAAGAFTAANTDVCTKASHGFVTGDGPVQLTTTVTLPAGLALATDYYVIRIDANTFYLATSRANAYAGTRVDITDAGTGAHTITPTVDATSRPAADTTSTYVPANTPTLLAGLSGSDVSVLRHTADGVASLVPTRGL